MSAIHAFAVLIASPVFHIGGTKQVSAPPIVTLDYKVQVQMAAKIPRKFHELEQPIQDNGDYSPSVGRNPTPDPTPTVPVHYLSPAERALPVIVPPAPRFVDAPPQKTEAAANINRVQPASAYSPATFMQDNAQISGPEEPTGKIPTPTAGSATGSTAVATYGNLPG